MRFHLCAGAAVAALAARLGLGRGELAALALTVGAVLAAEAMNTAVEKLCDVVEPRQDPRIRAVKDIAAGAVVLTALAAVGVGLAVFPLREVWALAAALARQPLRCALLALCLALAAAFVALGPDGAARLVRGRKNGAPPQEREGEDREL